MIHNETLYVSGGMTNIPFFNFPMFDEVEHACALAGAKHVYSPAEHDRQVLKEHGIDDITTVHGFAEGNVDWYSTSTGVNTQDHLLTWDFNVIINECDGIVMLPEWEKSTGAKWERIIAEALGKTIYLASKYLVNPGMRTETWAWEFTIDDRTMYLTNLLKAAVNDDTAGSRADRVASPLQREGESITWRGPSAFLPGADRLRTAADDSISTAVSEFGADLARGQWLTPPADPRISGISTQLSRDWAPDFLTWSAFDHHRLVDKDAEHRVFSPTGGAKGSKNTQLNRLPQAALEEVARHFFDGSCKYPDAAPGVANWMLGYDWSLSISAAYRHLGAWCRGEDNDDEFDRTHLAALIFHGLVLMTFEIEGWGTDDRYTAAKRNEFVNRQQ